MIHLGTGLSGDRMTSVSVCAIFKNDREFVSEFVEQFSLVANQWILVNTGSTDGTDQSFKQLLPGVSIYNFEWNHNFSEARNFALEKAEGDWILFCDIDERIKSIDLEKIKQLLPSIKPTIGALVSDCINTASLNWRRNDLRVHSVHEVIRIFRNHEEIRYSNRIHENIESSLDALKLQRLSTKFKIYHLGYAGDRYQEKIKRNERLINETFDSYSEKLITPPSDLIFYYCQHNWGSTEKIKLLLENALTKSSGKLRIYFLEACLCWHQSFGNQEDTRSYFLRLSKEHPDSIILTLKEAREAFNLGNIVRSEQLYRTVYHHCHLEGFIQTFRPEILMNLGMLNACQNKYADAMKYWLEYESTFGMDHTLFWQLSKLYYVIKEYKFLEELLLNPPPDLIRSKPQAIQELIGVIKSFQSISKQEFKLCLNTLEEASRNLPMS